MMTVIVVVGVALAVLVWLRRARTGTRRSGRLMPEALVRVGFDEDEILCSYPEGVFRRLAWSDIRQVDIRTTSEGPFLPDVFWGIHAGGDTPPIVFPQGATGEPELLQALQRKLPGFDNEALVGAMGSTADRSFLLWNRQGAPAESRSAEAKRGPAE
jgi:hypothetical protein